MNTTEIISQIDGVGAKYEELGCFNKSRYQYVYQKAFRTTEHVLKQLQDLRHTRGRGNDSRRNREFYNIIPFLGGRGSGKTSAMLSFMEGLKDYYREYERGSIELPYYFNLTSGRTGGKGENVLFTCLDCIDGSLLEEGEDTFKMILAQMYRKFLELDRHGLVKNTDYDYSKTRLFQSFEEVFRTIGEIEAMNNKSEQNVWNDSSMLTLKTMSNSLDLKMKFEKLVKDYLDLIQYEDYSHYSKSAPHILVITIDDLDLNIEKGFEMLEKIHRYMMIPNVLVLISADYKQLKGLCEKHFYKEVPKVDSILQTRYADIEVLAEDYLGKVFPLNYRIYMPGFGGNDLERIGSGSYDTKKVIFHLFYQRIGVVFDACGAKRHFYEENTLRQFVNLLTLLYEMPAPGELKAKSAGREKKQKLLENSDINSEIILSDIRNRMVEQKISDLNERKWIRRIMDLDPARSMRELVALVGRKSTNDNLKKMLEYYGYSYGEVLRCIYCWGREEDDHKGLLNCFMAFYTVKITNLYLHYLYESEESERRKALNTLKSILNGSLAGSWADKLMPQVERVSTRKDADAEHEIRQAEIGIRRSRSLQHFRIRTNFPYAGAHADGEGRQAQERTRAAEKLIKTLIVLCMMFRKREEGGQWRFRVQTRNLENRFNGLLAGDFANEEARECNTVITFANIETAGFNIMNFVTNALEYDDVGFDKMMKNMKADVLPFLLGENYVSSGIEESGVWTAFSEWEKSNGRFALPFYDLDLTYNVIKRVRRSTRRYKDVISVGEALPCYTRILKNIEKQLDECDKYYGRTQKGSSFRRAFAECPYVRWILNYEEELCADFPEIFEEFILKIIELQDHEPASQNDIGYDAGDMT